MTNLRPRWSRPIRAILLGGIAISAVTACSGTSTGGPAATPLPTAFPNATATAPAVSAPPLTGSPVAVVTPSPPASAEPDTGAGTAAGDVPDNAVFLTYHDPTQGFSIQYVEGWQVVQAGDGVMIRDKDSSETVAIVPAPADVATWVGATDLPALESQAGFKLIKQDQVKVGSAMLTHLAYHLPAPPDPVTGKQVPSTVDRYYVPGPHGLALISLSTPDGVDNVDAFRQMIESFSWS